jgi:hypothetical protein
VVYFFHFGIEVECLLGGEEKLQKLQGAKTIKELFDALDQFVRSKQVDSIKEAA